MDTNCNDKVVKLELELDEYKKRLQRSEDEIKHLKLTHSKQIQLLESDNGFLNNYINFLKSTSSSRIELLEYELNYIKNNNHNHNNNNNNNNHNSNNLQQQVHINNSINNDNSDKRKLDIEINNLKNNIQTIMDQITASNTFNMDRFKSLENEINSLKINTSISNNNNSNNNNNTAQNGINYNNNSSTVINLINDTEMKEKEDRSILNQIEVINNNNKNNNSSMVVVLSGIVDDNEAKKLSSIITKLGGRFETFISKNVTHVITQEPSRSEKVMGGSAAGSWILKPSFLLSSKNKMEKEEDHQWRETTGDSNVDLWIESSYKCQKVIAFNGGRKLFDGSRIAYYKKAADNNQATWLKILSCGNAELFPFDNQLQDNHLSYFKSLGITHILKLKKVSNDDGYNIDVIIDSINKNPTLGIKVLNTPHITKLLNSAEYLINNNSK